jgi:TonB-dependent starch-binding outer membrane protein SusC
MMSFYQVKKVLLFVLLLGSIQAWAQKSTVAGRVTSGDDGTGLPGVSIVEKGTTNGTVSDSDGNYSVSVSQNAVLVFSFVGYTSQELEVSGRTKVDVTLMTDVTALSEIVVVGYGQQEKKDVTGSLTSVSTKDFNRGVISSPQDLLTGRIAGVSVINNGGAPGSGAQIRIRGGSSLNASNDPLIVIDGFPVDNSTLAGSSNVLNTINPNDIESFTVLKDASATAIYGLRASNGVILITTKKGAAGKPTLQYNGTVSLSTLAKKTEVLTGDEYRDYIEKKRTEGTVSGLGGAAMYRQGTANTDWQEEIYQDAISHDHNISLAGAFKELPYRVSYGYTDQEGILRNTGFKRNSINVSLTPSLFNDKLKVTANLKTAFTKHNFGNEGAVGAAIQFDPTQPVKNGNSTYGGYFSWTELSDDLPQGAPTMMDPDGSYNNIAVSNPVALVEQTDNQSDVTRIIGNIQLDYSFDFLPGLRANVNAGIDQQESDGQNNQPSNAAFTFRNGPGFYSTYGAENKAELFDIYLNYLRNFDSHKIDATVGYSFQSFTRDGQTIQRKGDGTVTYGKDTDDDGKLDAPLEDIPNPTDLLSIFGRVNYGFMDKYLFTVTVRNDYSSRFAEENRSGIFPAASFGWRVSDENFMKTSNAVSDLKFRLSWGVTGQQDISDNPYPYFPRYTESTNTARYQFGDGFYYTYRPSPYAADIKWEETETLNIGLDFGFFENKLSGTVDVFKRETSDLIGRVKVPAGSNFSNYLTTNVGDMEIKGYELSLNYHTVNKGDFDLMIGANLTYLDREVTKLIQNNDPNFVVNVGDISGGVGNQIQRHAVGYAPFTFYTFQQVYQADGMPVEGLYADRTGEGGNVASNQNNKYYNKDPYANYLIGINSRMTYKKLDFAFSGRISIGNYVYNNVMSSNAVNNELYLQSGYFNNVPKAILKSDFNGQQLWSDFYVENASFFKLDNISLGYTLDNLLNNKLKARFSLTGQNLVVISDYTGIDPESNTGIDRNIYPRPRTVLFGINLTY